MKCSIIQPSLFMVWTGLGWEREMDWIVLVTGFPFSKRNGATFLACSLGCDDLFPARFFNEQSLPSLNLAAQP
jgi:hypothetical protein